MMPCWRRLPRSIICRVSVPRPQPTAALTAYQAAQVGDAMTLAPNALTANVLALDAVQEIAAALKALVVETEGNYTLGQILSLVLAALMGQTTEDGATFLTPNGIATRIQGTVNGQNERVR